MFDWNQLLSAESLPMIWFALLGVLLAGYCILDGFDLGVGVLHLWLPRNETERRLSINSIGPLWDGNEVWLVTFGGALFAMFPYAYATIFSAFYSALTLLLFALIFRAVSMEFRGKMTAAWATRGWDFAFFFSSLLASFLLGVAAGNLIAGLRLNDRGDYVGSLAEQLQPYCLATGWLVVALFALHGAIFLHLKLHGSYQDRAAGAMKFCWAAMAILYAIVTTWTLLRMPRASVNFESYPVLWLVPAANVVLVLATGVQVFRRRALAAFVMNGATIVSLVALLAAALFPNLINATDPVNDLRIADAASSVRTLQIGLLFVVIGLPFVLAYTTVIYWTFRGKTELSSHSY